MRIFWSVFADENVPVSISFVNVVVGLHFFKHEVWIEINAVCVEFIIAGGIDSSMQAIKFISALFYN